MGKQLRDMTDDELRATHAKCEQNCKNAPGWASAYAYAVDMRDIVRESDKRGLGLPNNYKIMVCGKEASDIQCD